VGAALAWVGCVDHPDFDDAQKVKPWETPCPGPAPLCLDGCATRTPVGEAVCRDASWSCPSGIREALCCDPVTAPERCEVWTDPCSGVAPCPGGYTCVKSRLYPIPSERGICRLGDLTIPSSVATCDDADVTSGATLRHLGMSPIKVTGLVNVRITCEDRKCTASNPCCQACSGAFVMDVHDERDGQHITLPVRTESLGCAGTNCGTSCYPMQPGRRYIVWGLFVPDSAAGQPGTLYYAGHCHR